MSKETASLLSFISAIILGFIIGKFVGAYSPVLAIFLSVVAGAVIGWYASNFFTKYYNLITVKLTSPRK